MPLSMLSVRVQAGADTSENVSCGLSQGERLARIAKI